MAQAKSIFYRFDKKKCLKSPESCIFIATSFQMRFGFRTEFSTTLTTEILGNQLPLHVRPRRLRQYFFRFLVGFLNVWRQRDNLCTFDDHHVLLAGVEDNGYDLVVKVRVNGRRNVALHFRPAKFVISSLY